MKEIGKLLELLNERKIGEEGGELYYLSNGIIRDDGGNILYSYRIISKEFGFIKWLVENDKIELGHFALECYKLHLTGREHRFIEYPIYESVIMILSIQDEPIRFLCEILK